MLRVAVPPRAQRLQRAFPRAQELQLFVEGLPELRERVEARVDLKDRGVSVTLCTLHSSSLCFGLVQSGPVRSGVGQQLQLVVEGLPDLGERVETRVDLGGRGWFNSICFIRFS